MRKEANLEQWRLLYDEAVKFKALEPWKYVWDMELLVIVLPKYEEPFFCSIMGKAGDCTAIGTYEGYDAIHGFYYIVDKQQIPTSQLVRYQNNMMCYFGNRTELTSKELKVIKDLGIKFRGKNEWVYFRAFETGYAPYILDEPQVVKLTNVFKQLYLALKELIEGRVKVDFERGNILLRKHNEESGEWETSESPNIIPPRDRKTIVLRDEILLAKIKKKNATGNEIELDTLYLRTIFQDKEIEKPFLGNLAILADHLDGIIIDQNMLTPKDDVIEYIFGMFINYVMEYGKPRIVYIRDEYIQDYLQDLCEKIGVSLKIRDNLRTIDMFEQEYLRRRF